MNKLIRITTIPLSLEILLKGQLEYMQDHFDVTAISAEKENLKKLGETCQYPTYHVEMTREITPIEDIKAVRKLYKFLKKEKPQIVHTHTPKAGIVGMLAAKLAGVPIRLHTVAGLPLMEATGFKRKILNSVEKMTYSCATQVFPNSSVLKDFIIDEKLISNNKAKIIGKGSSNGINTAYFSPDLFSKEQNSTLRQELNISENDFVFVFVGRLVSDKGINELIEAFKNIDKIHNNAKLLLVGFLEEELDPLKPETMQELKSNPNIIFVGYQKDVRPYFAISNALAFPSYREGFPNVVMQAGAMGLPSIVSDINGCNEIIKEEENGLIIPVKNSDAIRNAMDRLLNDNKLYNQLRANSREMIVNRFEQAKLWEALLEEYKNLLAQKKV
ncbi:glycosyltransferase family 4 protein [Brumimicrobium mesophilum]|uniref:glycosyltransferase family 4 protein n=1 Tax=Brumimicrobium mesophilum TaxID=392717 RepID=UPI0018FEA808|nr:glycosyltransferase family 4 protein [Brumimicrobium mesophilum]